MLNICLLNDRMKQKALTCVHRRSTLAAEWGQDRREEGIWETGQHMGPMAAARRDGGLGGRGGGGRRLPNGKKELGSTCFRKSS